MDAPDAGRGRRIWILLAILAVACLVHGPSLLQAPRADQLVYLNQASAREGLAELTVGAYALNRESEGDRILFRPVLYMLLGLESWAFGLDTLPWQATNLGLHLAILVLLYLCLTGAPRPRPRWAAFAVALMGVQAVGTELVTWSHLSGYLLFDLLLLVAVWTLRRGAWRPGTAGQVLLVGVLGVAAFTYELGVLACLALVWVLARGGADLKGRRVSGWFLGALVLVPVLYALASGVDLYQRAGDFAAAGQVKLSWKVHKFLLHGLKAAWHWWGAALLPMALSLEAGDRIAAADFRFHHPLALVVAVALGYLLRAASRKPPAGGERPEAPAWLALDQRFHGWLLVLYVALIVLGRIAERGFDGVIDLNLQYAYTFNLMAILYLDARARRRPGPWFPDTPGAPRWRRRALALVLGGVLAWNAVYTLRVNATMAVRFAPRRALVEAIGRAREDGRGTFSVPKDCAANSALSWKSVPFRSSTGPISIAEAVAPQLYRAAGAARELPCPEPAPVPGWIRALAFSDG